jgi:hypothetical protein
MTSRYWPKATRRRTSPCKGRARRGQSLIASSLAQYYKCQGVRAICIDTDPLGAQQLKLMDGNQLHWRRFDSLMENILGSDESFIVDNSASTFIPLWHHMVESGVLAVLREGNRRLIIRIVATGGQAPGDTLAGFKSFGRELRTSQYRGLDQGMLWARRERRSVR